MYWPCPIKKFIVIDVTAMMTVATTQMSKTVQVRGFFYLCRLEMDVTVCANSEYSVS